MQAQALYKMITQEQQAKVCAFVVDSNYKKFDEMLGLPVYEAEKNERVIPTRTVSSLPLFWLQEYG